MITRCFCTVFYYVEHARESRGVVILNSFPGFLSALAKIYSSATVTPRKDTPT